MVEYVTVIALVTALVKLTEACIRLYLILKRNRLQGNEIAAEPVQEHGT